MRPTSAWVRRSNLRLAGAGRRRPRRGHSRRRVAIRVCVIGCLIAAAVSAIGQCKELRYLALTGCGVTDAELVPLKKLTLLEHLTLSDNPKITDKGMSSVKPLDRLQVLYLSNTAITDKGLAELKVLDGLRTLNVTNTKVTADAAEKFTEDMPNLRVVRR